MKQDRNKYFPFKQDELRNEKKKKSFPGTIPPNFFPPKLFFQSCIVPHLPNQAAQVSISVFLSASRSHLCPLHDSNTSEAEASKLKIVKKTANLTSHAVAETEMKMPEYQVDMPMHFNSVNSQPSISK